MLIAFEFFSRAAAKTIDPNPPELMTYFVRWSVCRVLIVAKG